LASEREVTKEEGEEFAQRLDIDNGEKGKERYIETSGNYTNKIGGFLAHLKTSKTLYS